MWWRLKRQHDSRNILPCDFWDAVEEVHYYLLNKWRDEKDFQSLWPYPEAVQKSFRILDHWLFVASDEGWLSEVD